VFIAEELLFDTGVAVVIMVVVAMAARPRAIAGRMRDVATGLAAGTGVAAVVAGYPLWVQFFGPLRQQGAPFTPDFYKNDLAGFVQPSSSQLLHTAGSAAFSHGFQGGLPEYLAYLGWPMLAALALVAVRFFRRLPLRAAAVSFAVLSVLSLGGTLLAGGHEHEYIKLPWYWLQTLPVTGSVLPDRFDHRRQRGGDDSVRLRRARGQCQQPGESAEAAAADCAVYRAAADRAAPPVPAG
jgi:hypothetical protein